MSLPLDLSSSNFVLCSSNLTEANATILISSCIINSYTNVVYLNEITDNSFFTAFESLLKQLIPEHEEIKYFLLVNLPNNKYKEKIEGIAKELGVIDSLIILTNQFKEKIYNVWNNIKPLLSDDNNDNVEITFNSAEYVSCLECLCHTVNYTRIATFEDLTGRFTLEKFNSKDYMSFDISCVKCLNLFDNFEERKSFLATNTLNKLGKNKGNNSYVKTSVFNVLNRCCTKFGARLLRTWLMQPLQDKKEIENRLDMVEMFVSCLSLNTELRRCLGKMDDIQTINMKLARHASSEIQGNHLKLVDCAKLQRCIGVAKDLFAVLRTHDGLHKQLFFDRYVTPLENLLKYLSKLEELVSKTVVFDSKTREYTINSTIDENLKEIKFNMDEKFREIEEIQADIETEINSNNARASNNKKPKRAKLDEYINSGYIFELNKPDGDELLRRTKKYQLVSANKRSIMVSCDELREISREIKDLKADFKESETVYIQKVFSVVFTYTPLIENLISILSALDILSSFAEVVLNSQYTYCKPKIGEYKTELNVKESRHILLEHFVPPRPVISNDCVLTKEQHIQLITGINMGGKSTYLRQIGIIVILAHIGMYVPATSAQIPLIDQVYTRVGAGDLMLKGISTYMNEMIEVCSLIKSASDKSLLLIDELGRGTSTDDGVGISHAILYHISQVLNSYCLFATHFYELTEMENELNNVKNYYMSYSVKNGQVVMEYKILKGKNDSSFGVGMFHSLKFDEDTCNTLNKFIKEEEGEVMA